MKSKHIPILGTKYRDWEVIENKIYNSPNNRSAYWKVRCKCGTEAIRAAQHLINFKVGSCKSCSKLTNSFEQSYLKKIKQRAINKNLEFNLDLDYIIKLLKDQNYKCKLSNLPINIKKHWRGKSSNQTASLDRIDNTKGYVKDNVQWVHKDVNNMKGVFTEEYFIELCKNITLNLIK